MSVAGVLKQPVSVAPATFEVFAEDGRMHRPSVGRVPQPGGVLAKAGVVAPGEAVVAGPRPMGHVLPREDVRFGTQPIHIAASSLERPHRTEASGAPDPPRLSAEALRERAETEARTRMEAAIESARAEAYAAGHAAGVADAEQALGAEVEQLKASIQPDIERLEALWKTYHERVERQLVAVAVEVAAMLTSAPLPDVAREAAERALVQAVERLARGEGLSVRLHPVDYLRLEESGLVNGLNAAHPALRWTPDETLIEGDWIVESAETAVRSVRAELLESLRARLDLLQAIQDAPRAAGHRVAASVPGATSDSGVDTRSADAAAE